MARGPLPMSGTSLPGRSHLCPSRRARARRSHGPKLFAPGLAPWGRLQEEAGGWGRWRWLLSLAREGRPPTVVPPAWVPLQSPRRAQIPGPLGTAAVSLACPRAGWDPGGCRSYVALPTSSAPVRPAVGGCPPFPGPCAVPRWAPAHLGRPRVQPGSILRRRLASSPRQGKPTGRPGADSGVRLLNVKGGAKLLLTRPGLASGRSRKAPLAPEVRPPCCLRPRLRLGDQQGLPRGKSCRAPMPRPSLPGRVCCELRSFSAFRGYFTPAA